MKYRSMKISAVIILLALVSFACTEENNTANQDGELQLYLTDMPAEYDQVLIDIQDIQYHLNSEGEEAWYTVENINRGVYNLLDFTNGLDTTLTSESIKPGNISQLRLVLGNNNTLLKDGKVYNLKVPSGSTSGLKIQVNASIQPGITYKLWIDFDAARSIVETGNSKFILKPVIRTYVKGIDGSLHGVVSPDSIRTYVMSISEVPDTISTYSDTLTGAYSLHGMDAGMYKLVFQPENPYKLDSIQDVTVSIGAVTTVDTVFLEME